MGDRQRKSSMGGVGSRVMEIVGLSWGWKRRLRLTKTRGREGDLILLQPIKKKSHS